MRVFRDITIGKVFKFPCLNSPSHGFKLGGVPARLIHEADQAPLCFDHTNRLLVTHLSN